MTKEKRIWEEWGVYEWICVAVILIGLVFLFAFIMPTDFKCDNICKDYAYDNKLDVLESNWELFGDDCNCKFKPSNIIQQRFEDISRW